MSQLTDFFFYEDKLYKKIKVVISDDSVVAWCYDDESRVWLPRKHLHKVYEKAYTFAQAARILRSKKADIEKAYRMGELNPPSMSYNLSTFAPEKAYIKESDMYPLRDFLWDMLPKNRFGEPFRDNMPNEFELEHILSTKDSRVFMDSGDGLIRVFRS